ncbi:nitroreductase family deazaflavin-dependent oxidoreductase [bacterium]|nr:nitroreductase family deazaflavin-dependent oxidoreductase [bacterium]
MTLLPPKLPPASPLVKRVSRLPLFVYRLGLGSLLRWIPLLVLGTRALNSDTARYTVLEWRRHGRRYYVISIWGDQPRWVQRLREQPIVTLQIGQRVLRAQASIVTDRDEAAKVLYMFRKNSPLYDNVLASMSSVERITFLTLPQVADQFTIVRFEPQVGPFDVPPLPQLPTWVVPVGLVGGLAALLAWRIGRKGR